MSRRDITELSSVEFTGSLEQAFCAYGKSLTLLADRWGGELDIAAVDAEAAMSSMKGHWFLFGLDTRIRARRVAKRLVRARDLAAALAEEGEWFPRTYRKHFLGG
ncbi:hypothetical protein [Bailinhaonella thermotolerans]|uniref:Uncharacterized protein n=1 Tax=Bailinhaonella thermotolerans TaxID=1070861 RepID=A0A3A4A575_9ACTN|nr:hypothetical protein [Bailinhaonella thermotolerans]RJL19585.1 hypothetical protein D5H75_40265 [Bailinhaonella thermotolerans]